MLQQFANVFLKSTPMWLITVLGGGVVFQASIDPLVDGWYMRKNAHKLYSALPPKKVDEDDDE